MLLKLREGIPLLDNTVITGRCYGRGMGYVGRRNGKDQGWSGDLADLGPWSG